MKRVAPQQHTIDECQPVPKKSCTADHQSADTPIADKPCTIVPPDTADTAIDAPRETPTKKEEEEEEDPRLLVDRLSPSQRVVFDRSQNGESLFFTGEAGTGKSFLLNAIVKIARLTDEENVFVTASTGISACGIGGTTLHSFAGVGLGEEPQDELIRKLLKPKSNAAIKAAERWRNANMLIIDECSMLDPKYFVKLDNIGRHLRRVFDRPFGGIQIIMTGDFFQLPPVDKMAYKRLATDPVMIFDTDTWKQLIHGKIYILMEAHRQRDERFLSLLRNLRHGTMSVNDMSCIVERMKMTKTPNGIPPHAVKLYPTRREVDFVNEHNLAILQGEEHVFTATDVGDQHTLDMNKDFWRVPQKLVFKTGALVMFVQNIDVKNGVCNGATGYIEGFTPIFGTPIVRLTRGNHRTDALYANWEIKQGNTVMAKRTQIPLILAYAITIHKSQGMTLDTVEVGMDRIFEKSQMYVALSRCTTMDGLFLLGKIPNMKMLEPHPAVVKWWSTLNVETIAKPIKDSL
jgi:ATP-dependent DNA helicase PIF1